MGRRAARFLRSLGANVRNLRRARGWTQEGLAERAGVTLRLVGIIERGEGNPTAETIFRIANALRAPPRSLVEGADRLPGDLENEWAALELLIRDAPRARRARLAVRVAREILKNGGR